MRIAYITETYPPELNGVALTVERSVGHLRDASHEVELVRPRQPHEAPRDDREEWRTAGLPIPMYRDLRFGLALGRTLKQRWERSRPQLVHVATPGPLGWAAVRAARSLRLAVTSDFRTNFHQYSHYYGLGWCESLVCGYLRRLHNGAHRTFVPTYAVRRGLARQGFERLAVVGRGVDTERFSPEQRSQALRRQWGAGRTTPVVLYVGRLAAEKNVPLALQAFEAIRARQPHAQMVVVGDGPMRRRWENAFPAARFVGPLRGAELAEHYASSDIFLFPSLSDTFGNVVLEAMASGLAVVSYDCGAAGEHLEDGESGLLVRPGHEASFVTAACSLAAQLPQLRWMREAARRTALEATWRSVLTRFEAHLLDAAHAMEATHPRAACPA
ncbi:glycosyltransferase family 1 protein [Aquabacterium sp. A7-Y]|uniref:glycosyltransferase family 4 protein n=1 Tax=Aquabacterium sp. A7-Y TaxID=1349605 RepID=UPI00223E5503|nr:glycosyltransferase family 1 protein [Aquabacterium sp. A7-Y]MCW7536325.1 glycosyltransferase family 1 protein [Aquabacterium sp. A7-Y]